MKSLVYLVLALAVCLAFSTRAEAARRGGSMMNCNIAPAPTPASPQNLIQSPTTRVVRPEVISPDAKPTYVAQSKTGVDFVAMRALADQSAKDATMYASSHVLGVVAGK